MDDLREIFYRSPLTVDDAIRLLTAAGAAIAAGMDREAFITEVERLAIRERTTAAEIEARDDRD